MGMLTEGTALPESPHGRPPTGSTCWSTTAPVVLLPMYQPNPMYIPPEPSGATSKEIVFG